MDPDTLNPDLSKTLRDLRFKPQGYKELVDVPLAMGLNNPGAATLFEVLGEVRFGSQDCNEIKATPLAATTDPEIGQVVPTSDPSFGERRFMVCRPFY